VRLIAALLCLPALAGCTKPVTYYAAHADERHARVERCLKSQEKDNQDCRNAALLRGSQPILIIDSLVFGSSEARGMK